MVLTDEDSRVSLSVHILELLLMIFAGVQAAFSCMQMQEFVSS